VLDEETMLAKHCEDDVEVLQVVRPGGAVYQNIIKEDKNKPAKVGAQHVIHERLAEALHSPNGMTKNSKKVSCVRNTVLSISSSFIRT
jgi:hypothetical protein